MDFLTISLWGNFGSPTQGLSNVHFPSSLSHLNLSARFQPLIVCQSICVAPPLTYCIICTDAGELLIRSSQVSVVNEEAQPWAPELNVNKEIAGDAFFPVWIFFHFPIF